VTEVRRAVVEAAVIEGIEAEGEAVGQGRDSQYAGIPILF